MFRSFMLIIFVIFVSIFCFACGKGDALLVSAAASLQDVFTELQPAAEKACGRGIAYNFAASGVLRQQIESGAAVDVFVSASINEMDLLAAKVAIDTDSRSDVLGNTLTVIGQPDASPAADRAALRGLLDAAPKFAMGDPKLVPAGKYADGVLPGLGLTRSTNERVLLGNSVRQVLSYVETGAVPYGFVYGSDARLSADQGKSKPIYTFSAAELSGAPIVYPAAVLDNAPQKSPARKFVEFLKSEEAKKVFVQAGFSIP